MGAGGHQGQHVWVLKVMTPDGGTVVAPLPAILGRNCAASCMLAQYHQGQVTVARLVTLLDAIGIAISKRQVMQC